MVLGKFWFVFVGWVMLIVVLGLVCGISIVWFVVLVVSGDYELESVVLFGLFFF